MCCFYQASKRYIFLSDENKQSSLYTDVPQHCQPSFQGRDKGINQSNQNFTCCFNFFQSGGKSAAMLHVARSICRRAERRLEQEGHYSLLCSFMPQSLIFTSGRQVQSKKICSIQEMAKAGSSRITELNKMLANNKYKKQIKYEQEICVGVYNGEPSIQIRCEYFIVLMK